MGSHVSTPLQASPSLQTIGVPATQPVTGSQVSKPSQKLPSSQLIAAPEHEPPPQLSLQVQALPSSHGVPSGPPVQHVKPEPTQTPD
jgi:hypothetical protein